MGTVERGAEACGIAPPSGVPPALPAGRAGGTPEGGAIPHASAPLSTVPNPEVPEKAQRRQFFADYKLSILNEADACSEEGQIGALLRREGLYSSHLTTWRRQREEGTLSALSPKQRGRKEKIDTAIKRRLAATEAENQALKKNLKEAQLIIEYQKKTFEILRIPLSRMERGGSD